MALTQIKTSGIQDDAVTTAKIADGAVLANHVALAAVNESKLHISNSPVDGYFLSAQSGNAGGLTWAQVSTDLVSDTTPQLGGDLDSNGNDILLGDDCEIKLGTGGDLKLEHQSSSNHSYITEVGGGNLYIQASNLILRDAGTLEHFLDGTQNGAVNLYYDGTKKFETSSGGAVVSNGTGDAQLNIRGGSSDGRATIQFITDDNAAGSDNFRLRHDANNDFYLQNYENSSSWETNFKAIGGGAVELYHNNSKKFETDSSGTTTSGRAYITGTILQGTTDSGEANGDEATFANTGGNAGITIRSAVDNECKIYFSEGTSGGSQYRGAINYNHNTNYMAFSANEYEKMRLLSGGGMTFNGDTASANALDDYEIGSWTPSIANGTFTQYNQAWYIKIGKLVTCYFYIYNFSDTSSNTAFVIGGLPYAYNNSPKHESFFSIEHGGGDGNFNTNFVGLQGRIGQKSTTEVEVRQHRYNSSSQGVEHQHIGSAHLHTTFSYEAA